MTEARALTGIEPATLQLGMTLQPTEPHWPGVHIFFGEMSINRLNFLKNKLQHKHLNVDVKPPFRNTKT